MKLYFVRHGQTDANAAGKSDPSSGNDEPLNELGVRQATDLEKQLRSVRFDLVITSPYARCIQTAEILNQQRGLQLVTDSAWEEIHTDGYIDFATWSELCRFGTDTARDNIEPLQAFFDRVYTALDALTSNNRNKTVLLISHGGVQHAVYAYAHNLPLKGDIRISPMKNCEYRIYEF